MKKNTSGVAEDLQKMYSYIVEDKGNSGSRMVFEIEKPVANRDKAISAYRNAFYKQTVVDLEFSTDIQNLRQLFESGRFIMAYYKAERFYKADIPEHIAKVELKDKYLVDDRPGQLFVKYLVDLKFTEMLANNNGNQEKAEAIRQWFRELQKLFQRIFEDDTLELVFEEEDFSFWIKESDREKFDFNTLSSGFSAILDIVLDIILRMEKGNKNVFKFDMPGIVLIDEIETHLHLSLQKKVLDILTTIFPNIQFIISTHSPFVLNSLDNVVIYDLEKHIIVKNGLVNVPYGGIVEGYFKADEMSDILKTKYERYKALVKKEKLTDDDFEEMAGLELFLDEIPDYLALGISTEYKRLKIEFENREDI